MTRLNNLDVPDDNKSDNERFDNVPSKARLVMLPHGVIEDPNREDIASDGDRAPLNEVDSYVRDSFMDDGESRKDMLNSSLGGWEHHDDFQLNVPNQKKKKVKKNSRAGGARRATDNPIAMQNRLAAMMNQNNSTGQQFLTNNDLRSSILNKTSAEISVRLTQKSPGSK